ncbi:MAG: ABC transporter, permease protein 2 (cluster 1, maltose/g3p/polyamine/iron) [Ktedonobacterales bacterium]|jgi:alpha-glucoside transport system permease protein|nr:MAG: ABC transporter, permease protein 2 (cluster 1, maltose/g3p/polyamine/iron) [Ktedonobacterales bacterium]
MSTIVNPEDSSGLPLDVAGSNEPAAWAKAPPPTSPGQRVVRWTNNGILTFIVVLIALIWSVPTFGLFVASFRPASATQSSGWWNGLVPPWNFTIENYQQVLRAQDMGQAFINSLIISIPGTIIPVFVAAFAAYAFAWMKFPGRDWIFLTIVALLVVPIQMTLIPILGIFTAAGITGSFLAIWLAHTAFGLPFAIYLLRSFFGALPSDLFESATIDGASHLRIFSRILLPLAVPALASLIIFQFMWVWNDLLVALIFLGGSPERAPMPVTIANLVNSFGSNYEVLTAAAFISMALPLLVFFSLQRYFVRGILAGSVKG